MPVVRSDAAMALTYASVDVDAFVARHQASWYRLEELTRAGRSVSSLSAADLDEMVGLYQRASGHLAQARVSYAADTGLLARLTLLVGDANVVLYSQRDREVSRGLRTFFTETFPLAVWGIRRFILVAFLLMAVPWAVMSIWIAVSPAAFEATAPDAVREAYIAEDFEEYYSSQPAQNFAGQVFTNNVRVAALAFAAGILLCVVTAALLIYNGAMVGVAGGLFTHVGETGRFWGLILPHGLLELSAVVVAGAAGLRMGWTVIDPGDRRRLRAIAEEGRRMGAVLLGLVLAFGLAAFVEAYVTGRPWPTSLRVGIGIVVFAAFWGWVVHFATAARSARPGGDRATTAGADTDDDQSRPAALRPR